MEKKKAKLEKKKKSNFGEKKRRKSWKKIKIYKNKRK